MTAGGKQFVCLTIATASHLCRCEVLFESLKRQHPEARRLVFLLDRWPETAPPPGELFEVERVDEMGLEDFDRRMFRYTGYERASSLKAVALRRALELYPECQIALFFDADIEFFAPLTPVLQALELGTVCLTPHLTDTTLRHGGWKTASKFGIYNGGFLGVRRCDESQRCLRWLDDRLATECYNDVPEGAFNDQRWVDHIPALFDGVVSCRHPGLNLAYWNLHERKLGGTIDAPTANGEPVVFYHYSGWDLRTPRILSRYQGNKAKPVPQDFLLGEILARYLAVTQRSVYFSWRAEPSSYDFYRSGKRISEMEHIYFSEFLESQLPNSYDPYSEGLPDSPALRWVNIVGRLAQLAGYRLDAKRQFLLYRWTRRALENVGSRARKTKPVPSV